ncbi:MAG: SLC26A/SulP transporter family protein, partial [Candidatus Sericytochromatia bacterium]|nr:SLC26A/SulP transporter family protein [Candidatus Tanganyikabacteria bacterium]
ADLDKELRSGGLVNLISAATGGYVAALSVSRTLVAFQSGGRTRLTGFIIAAVCGAAFVGAAGLVAYMPRAVLAGLLLAMGLGLLYDWLVAGYRRLHREDYAVVVLILGTTVAFGFAPGVAVGMLAACAAFAFNYARTHVIRQELSGKEVRSAFERSAGDREILDRHGAELLVCRFQGYLFFGTAYAILQHLRRRLAQPEAPRVIALDFTAVQGLDTSAVVTFQKLRQIAARADCKLVFAAMDAQVSKELEGAGCLARDAQAVEVLPDLDHALEWSEDRILDRHRVCSPQHDDGMDRWLAAEFGDLAAAERVRAVLERRTYGTGDYVFREGDPSDSLYLVESGRVSVVLGGNGTPIRLHTYLGGTVVGEMGLYTTEPRSASVVADEPAVLLRLSAKAFAALAANDPVLANALHSLVVRILAHRLAGANAEKAALKRLGTLI